MPIGQRISWTKHCIAWSAVIYNFLLVTLSLHHSFFIWSWEYFFSLLSHYFFPRHPWHTVNQSSFYWFSNNGKTLDINIRHYHFSEAIPRLYPTWKNIQCFLKADVSVSGFPLGLKRKQNLEKLWLMSPDTWKWRYSSLYPVSFCRWFRRCIISRLSEIIS